MLKKHLKLITVLAIVALVAVLLSGCMAERSVTPEQNAGFLMGIWHGWIAPFALIMGLFNKSVTIYEVNNTGWWYDFGYYMAIISGFGGLTLSRKKKKD